MEHLWTIVYRLSTNNWISDVLNVRGIRLKTNHIDSRLKTPDIRSYCFEAECLEDPRLRHLWTIVYRLSTNNWISDVFNVRGIRLKTNHIDSRLKTPNIRSHCFEAKCLEDPRLEHLWTIVYRLSTNNWISDVFNVRGIRLKTNHIDSRLKTPNIRSYCFEAECLKDTRHLWTIVYRLSTNNWISDVFNVRGIRLKTNHIDSRLKTRISDRIASRQNA